MQIEVYNMEADESNLTITLEAVCDSFSSLLWDIEYYQCGSFEVYIAANPKNLSIFQTGRLVGRDDDSHHFGIIESEAHEVTELEKLLRFAESAPIIEQFDDELFQTFVDHIVIYGRDCIEFKLKCGLTLKEAI